MTASSLAFRFCRRQRLGFDVRQLLPGSFGVDVHFDKNPALRRREGNLEDAWTAGELSALKEKGRKKKAIQKHITVRAGARHGAMPPAQVGQCGGAPA